MVEQSLPQLQNVLARALGVLRLRSPEALGTAVNNGANPSWQSVALQQYQVEHH